MVLAVIIGSLEGIKNLPLSSAPVWFTCFAVAASVSSARIAAVTRLFPHSLSPSWLQIPHTADCNLDLPLSPMYSRLAACVHVPVPGYAVLGIEARALCMVGMHPAI